MKWKDTGQNEQAQHDGQEEYFEENYSPLKRRKFDFGVDLSALLGKPVFWYVVGACVFILLIVILIPTGGTDSRQLGIFEDRLAQLEKRILFMEEITNRLSALEKDAGSVKPLIGRLERLEATLAKKLNDMEEKINQLTRQQAVAAKPGGVKVHVVQKGDTLYSISKRYGVSIDELRKINKLAEDAPIQPGQRLLVK